MNNKDHFQYIITTNSDSTPICSIPCNNPNQHLPDIYTEDYLKNAFEKLVVFNYITSKSLDEVKSAIKEQPKKTKYHVHIEKMR